MQHFDRLRLRDGILKAKCWHSWTAMRRRVKLAANGHPLKKIYFGITVCERWQKFDNFFEDMGLPPTEKHSLDRIDGSGNYEKSNCRWATATEQSRNRPKYVKLSFEIAQEVRSLYKNGHTQVAIASLFKTSQAQVSEIILNKRWI